jgi:hypothetical protein
VQLDFLADDRNVVLVAPQGLRPSCSGRAVELARRFSDGQEAAARHEPKQGQWSGKATAWVVLTRLPFDDSTSTKSFLPFMTACAAFGRSVWSTGVALRPQGGPL